MTNLMKNITSKTPHYIRCIKPNTTKSSTYYDESLCLSQCRYLGLLENIKARRQLPKYAVPIIQRTWRSYRAHSILNGMKKSVIEAGRDWINIKWGKEPANDKLKEAFSNLKYIYYREMAKQYRKKITPEYKALMDWKLSASMLFKNQKRGYTNSIRQNFKPFTITQDIKTPLIKKDTVRMAFPVNKIHRRNTKKQVERNLILTTNSIYILSNDNSKIKDIVPINDLSSISTSKLNDNIFVLHCNNNTKGDLILTTAEDISSTKVICIISYIWMQARKRGIQLPIKITNEIKVKCYQQIHKFIFQEASEDGENINPNKEMITKSESTLVGNNATSVKTRRRAKSFATNKFENKTTSTHKRNHSINANNYNSLARVTS